MGKQSENIPKLRFPEFSAEWGVKRLKDIASKVTDKNKDDLINNVFTNSASRGIVNQKDYFDKDIANQNNLKNYYIVERGDFIYNPRISNHAPVGPISLNQIGRGVMSPLYSVFRMKCGNLKFIEKYFSTIKWHEYMKSIANYGARSDRMNITTQDFYLMPITLPSEEEQQKIANFLTTIDNRIEKIEEKKILLENYKKGVMQQIFSQELRFKGDDGNDYPDWERKKLGDICNIKKGEQLNREHLKEDDLYPAINGGIMPSGYTNRYNTEENIITISEGGNSCGYINFIKSKFWSGGHCYTIEDLKEDINNLFLYQILKFNEILIMSLRVGSGLPNIQKKDLNSFNLNLPPLPEQQKIANFLTTLDKKIENIQTQISESKTFKKGLLQQMFV